MTEKPKRPWFRFHLLTAVLMMLAAGGFVRQNSIVREETVLFREGWNDAGEMIATTDALGWPFVMRVPDIPTDGYSGKVDELQPVKIEMRWSWIRVVENGMIVIGILLGVALVSEAIIRRRESPKI